MISTSFALSGAPVANSAAIFAHPDTHGDCVRQGITLYGATPFADRPAKALGLRPNHVPSWLALAKIQSETYLLGDCRASLQRLRELDPKNAEAALLDAGLMGRMGDARAHLAALQHAYESEIGRAHV
mgnify:CR=1 FL=1